MQDLKIKFLLIIVITALFGYIAYPSDNKPGFKPGSTFENQKLNLGLDLQGGAWFRLRLKAGDLTAQEVSKGTDDALSILSRRINLRGLKEPRIQKVGADEIQIEVPGLKTSQQVDQFKKVILSAGHLEFKIEAPEDIQAAYRSSGKAPKGYRWYDMAGSKGEAGGGGVLVKDEMALDGRAIEHARPGHDEGGRPIVHFSMTPEGGRAFEQITAANIDKQLAIILDDHMISAPTIQSKIGREGQITGRFTQQEVSDLVTVLSTGSLVAPLEIVGSSYLGPALGQDAIDRGLKACWISLMVVMVFMLGYYRHAGMVANIAVLMNVILLLGLLAIFGATLTLPGIAGIVLTLGMAVDANIIIFERMREEQEKGKTATQALEAGHDRAYSAVLDANLTTLLTGIILYYFGTGPIQGFAITLSLGILTTLFTALTCSKIMLALSIQTGLVEKWTMMRLMSKPNIPFMKLAPKAVAISLILILVGVIAWFARGDSKYGIDFRGGVSVHIRFKKPTSIDEVRNGVAAISGPSGPKYPAAEVQSIILGADDSGARESLEFQIRTLAAAGEEAVDPEKMKEILVTDLRKQFAGKIPEPSILSGLEKIDAPHPYAGGGTIRISLAEDKPVKETVEKIQKKLTAMGVQKPVEAPAPFVQGLDAMGKKTEDKASTYEVFLIQSDFTSWNSIADRLSEDLRGSGYRLSEDPFPSVETVSASIVSELKEKAIIALVLSWIGIILYLAVRFNVQYGVAAVVALVHDVLIAITWTAIAAAIFPKAWGIDLSVTLTTVAAALTIIGYSVNDTVVIYDRMRENLREIKTKGLSAIIDESLNQTLSRTIITSVTVFFVLLVLLGVTLTSGNGIAAMSFPLLIGVIVGTYSTLFIAAPIIYWWRNAMKPSKSA